MTIPRAKDPGRQPLLLARSTPVRLLAAVLMAGFEGPESVDTSGVVAGFEMPESVDTPGVVAGFEMPESVDTSGVVAGFGGHARGRPPRPRTATPAAFR
jgi:hypothetical protein